MRLIVCLDLGQPLPVGDRPTKEGGVAVMTGDRAKD